MDGRRMGRTGLRWDDIFLPAIFLPDLPARAACATPSGLAIGGRIAHPGCADVPRPWATVSNAFGVQNAASVSEIPTYVGPLMTAVGEQPVVRPRRRRGDAKKGRQGERNGQRD